MAASAFRRGRRVLIATAALGLLAALVWWRWGEQRVPVATAVARAGPLSVHVITNGSVEPIHDVQVRAAFAGRIVTIPDGGARLAKGAVLVRLDDRAVRAALARAQSDRVAARQALVTARAERDLARTQLAGDRYLYARGALTAEHYAQSRLRLAHAQARLHAVGHQVSRQIAALDAQIAQLRAEQAAASVRAPCAGTAYRVLTKAGEVPQPGSLLLRFADLRQLRVRANIDQADRGRVRSAQAVRITSDAYPERAWAGQVQELVPDVVFKGNRAVSDALVALQSPVDGLVPGMNVDVDITVAQVARVVQVPVEAIFSEQGHTVVYQVAGDRARRTVVQTGAASVTDVAITKGVAAGAVVVVGPAEGLRDGALVVQRPLDIRHHML